MSFSSSRSSSSNHAASSHSKYKLPQIKLPEFNKDYLNGRHSGNASLLQWVIIQMLMMLTSTPILQHLKGKEASEIVSTITAHYNTILLTYSNQGMKESAWCITYT